MQFLIMVIGLITAASVWYWRYQRMRDAAGHIGEAAKTAANLPRRMTFQYKARKQGLKLVDDPREAAAIMMMEVARAGGDVTVTQKQAIAAEIVRHFEFTKQEADDLVAHAGWVSRDAPIPEAVMQRMSKVIVSSNQLGPREIVDLDTMLVCVSEADGAPKLEQLAMIQIFRETAGLRT